MSSTETHIGELKEIATDIDGLVNKAESLGISYYSDDDGYFEPDDWDRYIALHGKLYEFVRHDQFEGEDYVKVDKLPNGNLSFTTSFYNGSCGLSEMLEEGMDNAKS